MDYTAAEKFVIDKLRQELPEQFYFHDWQHTVSVIKYAEQIATAERIAPNNLMLLKTAALFHDTGYFHIVKGHEAMSVDFARQTLPVFGYPPEAIEQICSLIPATCYPQHPETELQEILCDADLFYMTTDSLNENAEKLRKELKAQGMSFTDLEWYKFELRFMESHKFFTQYASEAYKKVLPQILAELDAKIKHHTERG